MSLQKVLVTVKTYPTLSKKYQETVCTAGFTEEGEWIRIYPIPFRRLKYEKQYSKYDWVEFNLERNRSDFRPETYRPLNHDQIKVTDNIKSDGRAWDRRRDYVLKKGVYTNLEQLIAEAKDKQVRRSLAVFKPSKFVKFLILDDGREWDKESLSIAEQEGLFENLEGEDQFKVVNKLPYRFQYQFEDDSGKTSKLSIIDWEIGALYWNMFTKTKSESQSCEAVKQKYWNDFALTKDLHLFLGTTKTNHFKTPNPFMIIGTFHPGFEDTGSLF